jgi:hypothetical protein
MELKGDAGGAAKALDNAETRRKAQFMPQRATGYSG